jgi:bifunctional UDP-N-acetylglucosamine pyrophosphorylase/glucosamine-1-phosphate N-acetyltransferase
MENVQVIILAAGAGTRMQSDKPKVLHETKGKALIKHLLETLEDIGYNLLPVIIVGHKAEDVKKALGNRYIYVHQKERKGTAHAVGSAGTVLRGVGDIVLTFFGDTPFITKESILKLVETQRKNNSAFTMGVTRVPHFNDWYKGFHDFGRIVRDADGKIIHNVEKKNFTEEILAITEVNPGFYCFDAEWLWNNINKIPLSLPAKEHYLPGVIDLAREQKRAIADVSVDPKECLGANTKDHLAEIEMLL